MRTLQEKYNAIQEGKFSKEHFLAEARMQQPQLITRFNGYDDAVQILKNRGMIQEANLGHNEISSIHQEGGFTFLVRQLDPIGHGVPIQLYIFTKDTKWTNHEEIQSDIFDHLFGIIHEFELKIFQSTC